MAFSVLVSIVASVASAAPSKSALEELQRQQDSIKQELQNIQSQINSLEYEQSVATAKKQVLDQQVTLTQEGIDNLTAQIEQCGLLIEEKEEEVEEAIDKENAQWDLYKIRMRAMEENGRISYYAIIFGATDFSDMLFRIDAIASIMEHDEQLYEDFVEARQDTQTKKAELEDTKADMEEIKQELIEQESILEEQVAEAEALISEIQSKTDEARDLYNQKSIEEDKIKDEISEMEEALKKASAGVVGTGQFIWPSATSTYVTSYFGPRNTGIPGASTNHKGVDIGAKYGTNVLAADGGTVLTATYSSSYGYYVTISHGNGYTTLYAHMSKLLVSSGDTVSQGDVVGLCGATGIANGAHVHFEVWQNGTRINPLQFFSSGSYTVSPSA
jgi:murein DD-endopeptidase MepM/ murein hydrolase activator NlpD